MVEAGQPKSCLDRFEQGKAVVVRLAFEARFSLVCLDCEDDVVLILGWEQAVGLSANAAVVVLVPHDDDRVLAPVPRRRSHDGLDCPLDRDIALEDQTGVKSLLSAVGQPTRANAEIKSTERISVATAVLVIALIGHDEGEGGHVPGSKVSEGAMRTTKANDVVQTVAGEGSVLDVLEVGERVVLHGVSLHNAARGEVRESREITQVGRGSVAIVDAEDGAEGETLLVGLPTRPAFTS